VIQRASTGGRRRGQSQCPLRVAQTTYSSEDERAHNVSLKSRTRNQRTELCLLTVKEEYICALIY